jgi:phage tail-like protein
MKDPYIGYNFIVKIGDMEAGFTEVSGLNIETEFDIIKEGGVNDYEHKLPRGIKYSDITLKRGLVDRKLWDWYKEIKNGTVNRKNGSIKLLDYSGEIVMSWSFEEAFPIKWDGPMLNAATNTIVSETLVFAHHGLSMDWGKETNNRK